MTLTYQLDDKLYLNITNKCNCACVFCIRMEGDGVGDGENLWLSREPSAAEVIEDLKGRDLTRYKEVVLCGYGEPTENLDAMLEICAWLKDNAPDARVRLNTNGLAELSHQKPVAPLLKGLVDIVSISLNAPDSKRYVEVTNPVFGEKSFKAMLSFAKDCKEYVPDVIFSVVGILSDEETARCREIAGSYGIPLRIREKL